MRTLSSRFGPKPGAKATPGDGEISGEDEI